MLTSWLEVKKVIWLIELIKKTGLKGASPTGGSLKGSGVQVGGLISRLQIDVFYITVVVPR